MTPIRYTGFGVVGPVFFFFDFSLLKETKLSLGTNTQKGLKKVLRSPIDRSFPRPTESTDVLPFRANSG